MCSVGFADMLLDALDGYDWVTQHMAKALGLDMDFESVFLLGWSAGAHLASLVVSKHVHWSHEAEDVEILGTPAILVAKGEIQTLRYDAHLRRVRC